MPFPQGEIIDTEYFRCRGGLALREGHDQPQDRRRVHGDAQPRREPGACAPGQFQPEPGEHARQRHAPPAVPAGQTVGLHRERDLRARWLKAEETQDPQDDQDRPPSGRTVGYGP
jgi:hypothetical protein